jgi:hypothetical protein
MNHICRYTIGIGGIGMNLAVAIPLLIACGMPTSSPRPLLVRYVELFVLYNIPQVPGYLFISMGFGKYVAIGNIAFQNIVYPSLASYIFS